MNDTNGHVMPRASRRSSALIGFLTALAVVAMIAACTPDQGSGGSSSKPDRYNLGIRLVDDGLDVTWDATMVGNVNGYAVQVIQSDPPEGTWSTIATVGPEDELSVHYSDVIEGVVYRFRVGEFTEPGSSVKSWSAGATALYVVPKLPLIHIDTENGTPIVEKKVQIPMQLTFDPNGSEYEPLIDLPGTIRGRGNSTWNPQKKPYQIKFASKTKFMGLASAKKFVLLANYYDPSQLRTYTAAQVSQATDLAWTPGYRWVEVILNGQYIGVYQLAEKVERDKNKVNIDKMSETDIDGEELTGGYLLQIEGRMDQKDKPGWKIGSGMSVTVEDPDEPTPEQFAYIKTYVDELDSVLHSSRFTDPVDGYRKYLDVESFIDYWLVQETTRNSDGMWDSGYFYKQRNDPLLHFGPIWDFDLSMGNPSTTIDTSTEGWATLPGRRWPRRITQDPSFISQLNTRWVELLPEISQIPDRILTAGASLEDAKFNERARWGKYQGAERPQDEPQYLADWLNDRIAWMTDALADWAGDEPAA